MALCLVWWISSLLFTSLVRILFRASDEQKLLLLTQWYQCREELMELQKRTQTWKKYTSSVGAGFTSCAWDQARTAVLCRKRGEMTWIWQSNKSSGGKLVNIMHLSSSLTIFSSPLLPHISFSIQGFPRYQWKGHCKYQQMASQYVINPIVTIPSAG